MEIYRIVIGMGFMIVALFILLRTESSFTIKELIHAILLILCIYCGVQLITN